mmetsp:Transcript_47251/g.70317  ORF Transcript_47251/g.70317 Transcript_47251/m.70317 type:complete len:101 (-) Transcript_47251:649-951(-)
MSSVYSEVVGGGTKRNHLFVGGKRDAKSKQFLSENGVTHILNATPAKEGGVKNAHSLHYCIMKCILSTRSLHATGRGRKFFRERREVRLQAYPSLRQWHI